jgi:putative nucleotidyltransferase with HDIG domain
MKIDEIIAAIDTLKPVSYVGDKIMEILKNPNSSVADLVEIIKFDSSMTANLLRICNSSYFGLQKEIVSIKQAVALLGVEKVAGLIMMGNSAKNFEGTQPGYDLEDSELWRYSVSSALIAQEIAEAKGLPDISLIFTSALLKDIGKAVLHTYVESAQDEIKAAVENKGMTFVEAEHAVIGIDHTELGAKIAEHWNFSPAMVDLIRNHHTPQTSAFDARNAAVVYLADAICMMIGIGVGSDGLAYRYHQDVVDLLNFTEIDLQQTIANFREKIKEVEELVQVSKGEA